MALRRSFVTAVLCCSAVGVLDARQQVPPERGFAGGGVSVVTQFQEPDFGGYFCCEAGGTEAGFLAEAGWFVSRRISIRGEAAAGLAFTDDLRAPRFVQENRHHDWIFSGLVAFHARTSGRVRLAVLSGFGAAVERTRRTSRLYRFVPPAGMTLGDPQVQETTGAVPAATLGLELPIAAGRHLRVVPQVRARFLWRGEVSRFQDGLGRWMLAPALELQMTF